MASSIIPKFKLNLDQPGVDPYTDFSPKTQDFLSGISTPAQARIARVGLGDASAYGDFSDMTSSFLEKNGLAIQKEKTKDLSGAALAWQNVKTFGGYIGDKIAKGTGETVGALYNAPSTITRAANVLFGQWVGNPVFKALGMQEADWNKSFGELVAGGIKEAGAAVGIDATIDTSGWKPGVFKNMIDDAQSGTNIMYGMEKRAAEAYEQQAGVKADVLALEGEGWKKATEIGGAVAEAIPASLQYALPYGAAIGAVSALSRNITEQMDKAREEGTSATMALGKGTSLGAIDSISEMIFGAFGEASALLSTPLGSIAKGGLKTFVTKLGNKTVGKILMTMFAFAGSAGEEGLEEAIAYPFSQFVTYLYDNPDGNILDFKQYIDPKEWINNFVVGTLSGAILGGGSFVSGVATDVRQGNAQAKLEKLGKQGAELVNMDPAAPGFEKKAVDYINDVGQVAAASNHAADAAGIPNVSRDNSFRGKKMVRKPATTAPQAPSTTSAAESAIPTTPQQTAAPAPGQTAPAAIETTPVKKPKVAKEFKSPKQQAPIASTEENEVQKAEKSLAPPNIIAATTATREDIRKLTTPQLVAYEGIVRNELAKDFGSPRLNKTLTDMVEEIDKRIALGKDSDDYISTLRTDDAIRREKILKKEASEASAQVEEKERAAAEAEKKRQRAVRSRVKKELPVKAAIASEAVASKNAYTLSEEENKWFDQVHKGSLSSLTSVPGIDYVPAEENSLSQDQKDLRDLFMVSSGRRLIFIKSVGSLDAVGGAYFHGIEGSIFMNVSQKNNIDFMDSIGHEFYHLASRNGYISGFRKAAYEALGIKDDQQLIDMYIKKHSAFPARYIEKLVVSGNIIEEFLAERSGEIFTDPRFWDKLAKKTAAKSESVFSKILQWIKNIVLAVPATAKEMDLILNAMDHALVDSPALREYEALRQLKQDADSVVAAASAPAPDISKFTSTIGEVKGKQSYIINFGFEPTQNEKDILINAGFTKTAGTNTWHAPINRMKPEETQEVIDSVVASYAQSAGTNLLLRQQPVNNARTGYTGTGNAAVDAALEASSRINHRGKMKEKLDALVQAVKDMTLGAIRIGREYGNLRWKIENFRNAGSIAASMIQLHIMGTYNHLNSDQYLLAKNYVIFRDMMEDVHRGTFDPKMGGLFDIPGTDFVEEQYKKAYDSIHNPANKDVLDAIDARDKALDEIRQKLIHKAGLVGWDLTYLNSRTGYMVHAINEYLEEQAADAIRKGRTIAYKAREGSSKNYMTDLATTDFIIMKQMMKDAARIDMVNEIKKLDIYKSLKNPDGSMKPIPAGYAELTMGQMGMNFNDLFQVAAKQQKARDRIQKMGISPTSKQAIKILIEAGKARSAPMIVPVHIRDAMLEEFRSKQDPHAVIQIVRAITSAWKAEQLFAPTKIIKYNTKNFFGDSDALLMTYPKAFLPKYTGVAIKDLLDLYRNGNASERMVRYMKFGGLTMGLSNFDMDSLHLFEKFKFYPKDATNGFNTAKAFKTAWNGYMKNAKGATEFREQLLRYAAFSYLEETLDADARKGGKGLPTNYGASVPKEIQSITNIHRRAYQLAQDALGNYGDVTMMGQSIAKTAWPFYRFVEVNTKRYFRIFKNSFYNDPNIALSAGQQVVDKLGKGFKVTGFAVMRLGRLALLYGAYEGLLEFWNRIIMGRANDQLPEDIKKTSHLTLGYINGKVRYIQDLSSFAQFYGLAGLEGQFPVLSDLMDILEGRQTFKEKVGDMLKAPINTIVNGLNPAIKLPFEAGFGKTAYPDIFKSRPIRDTWEYAMKAVGFDNLYRSIAGKPQPGGSYLSSLDTSLFNSVYVGDAALWDTYGAKEDYLKSIGEYQEEYFIRRNPKSMAIYYYKTALRMKDYDSARDYLEKYVAAGGTSKTFNLSMKAMDPLYGMKTKVKNDFLASMTPEQKDEYEKAVEYVKELKSTGADLEKEIFSQGR